MINSFSPVGVIIPLVTLSLLSLSPPLFVPRSYGCVAAPATSYILNIMSPVPTLVIETVIPLRFGEVAALAAYTI